MTISRYDILFEKVKIGPVTAPNRFYQVPHCNGMGHRFPRSLARMRGIKAEGGWGVVCTEEVEIHPSSDITPYNQGRLWDDSDIPNLQLMTDAVHEHGSLAGIELVYQGLAGKNHYTRLPTLAPTNASVLGGYPMQARAMDKTDIKNLRKWYKDAAVRSKKAGFDIVYVYAGHSLSILMHFLSRQHNDRTDEYGGSLENRARLLKEVLIDTKEAVGDTCGIALRIAVDELLGKNGIQASAEGSDVIEMLAEIPDLWDVNISSWENDSATSRFAKEGFQEQYTKHVKSLTTKPVVGVGRFTSPDAMVSQIKRGVLDLIGAARPSIADPFLPNKIKNNELDSIRECIGCNICVSSDNYAAPIRCTQNPTMGEEWRRDWHPERIKAKHADESVLIVGAGPAGLECAHALAKRGYEVIIAEKRKVAGGRVLLESLLPGLAEWKRVIDYRLNALKQMPNVEIYYDSEVTVDNLSEFGFENVIIATGSHWKTNGQSRETRKHLQQDKSVQILTPDDIMSGTVPTSKGNVLIYDADHYYMASVLAEKCVELGCKVTYMSNASQVAEWSNNTLEQHRTHVRLINKGVNIVLNQQLDKVEQEKVFSYCVYNRKEVLTPCKTLVLVTERLPNDGLYTQLKESHPFKHFALIGDAYTPGIIAQAVHSGHLEAQLFGDKSADKNVFNRDKDYKGL
ncbi:MAG: FAD-dependent oxidoreductase [Proteobacteria bacterium]|nr:FAD-dependent oxidoreductase [Pseudomonadota bacterium]